MGEAVARKSSAVLSRRGRSGVRVRVVGVASLGWLEVAEAWGCSIEAMVASGDTWQLANRLLKQVSRIPAPIREYKACKLPPLGETWNGLFLCTIHNQDESTLACKLFKLWQPEIGLFAFPEKLSRKDVIALLPSPLHGSYKKKMFKCRHSRVGGVTHTAWHIVHLSRHLITESQPPLMTMDQYPRPLQTALDDVLGGVRPSKAAPFEPRDDLGDDRVGYVWRTIEQLEPDVSSFELKDVYATSGLGPDISLLSGDNIYFWVSASSVFSKSQVIRQVNRAELYSMWDYEGKEESKGWTQSQQVQLLTARVQSPPAKMIRVFVHAACDAIVAESSPSEAKSLEPSGVPTYAEVMAGRTDDVLFSPMELQVESRLTATTADDAEVDLSTWALPEELAGPYSLVNWLHLRGLTPSEQQERITSARAVLRRFAVKWWAYAHRKRAYAWLEAQPREDDKYNVPAIEDGLRRLDACSYFSWVRGSRILVWEISSEFLEEFRDGGKFFHLPGLAKPTGMTHNLPAPSREAEIEARKKVFKMKFQWYIEKKYVSLVIGRFSVVKLMVDGIVVDIRVVWDAKSNGYNRTVWTPSFMLDNCRCLLDLVVKWLAIPMGQYLENGSPPQDYTQPESNFIKSKMGDIDVGQQFHNFLVHPSERQSLGLRVIETNGTAGNGAVEDHEFYRSCRYPFGCKSSPYMSCQAQNRILEECRGDRNDPRNCWQWHRVVLNLPCSKTYDASVPRIMLLRRGDGKLATRHVTFVDDIRPVGRDANGDDHTSKACRQLKSRMNKRGNQATDRKYRPPSYTQGAWNGVVLHTNTPFPRLSTTQKKWNKLRAGLDWILQVAKVSSSIETAGLRRVAGLAVNVTEVYTDARAYLKGIFNAIEAFRWDRDIDGWRLQGAMDSALLFASLDDEDLQLEVQSSVVDRSTSNSREDEPYPVETKISPEMLCHVKALSVLFESETAVTIPIRPTDCGKLRHVIGDASAEGFGAGTQYPDGTFEGRDGLWQPDFAEGGSNLREAQNLTNHLLSEIRASKHDGCEVWVFTDNSVFSYVLTKGLSSARHLFNLVLELRIECRKHEIYLRPCHISGLRMILSGMDGWSRGNHDAGISLGFDIRDLIPLNLSAWEVADGAILDKWCRSWMGDDFTSPLTPEGWFDAGQHPGVHIWAPPPAAALIVLEQLARSRQLRPYTTTHVVIIPRLLYQEEWRGRFQKEVDLWFLV